MLNPHEFATLIQFKEASDPIDLNRTTLDLLLQRQLVMFDKLTSGKHRVLVTASAAHDSESGDPDPPSRTPNVLIGDKWV